jgi:UDP-glucuronate 4-epimerase
MMRIMVTGAAGFIGYHVTERLLARGDEVVGVDNLNAYYDVRLKYARLSQLARHSGFTFVQQDIARREDMAHLFECSRVERIVHLAAQAGIRHSLNDPHAYVDANLVGFANVLEGCRQSGVTHLVFASSSSVYGANIKVPFSVHDRVDHPLNLYAATKKANELLAHAYSHLYGIPTTGLRFFTVYGPWGRPDMAYFRFTEAIVNGKPIDLFNYGRARRDFTYVDDVVEAVERVLDRPPMPAKVQSSTSSEQGASQSPYRLFNVGNNHPVDLLYFVSVLERCLGRTAQCRLLPPQAGDMQVTFADIDDLQEEIGFQPSTTIDEGLDKFVAWYREHHDGTVWRPTNQLLEVPS